MRYRSQVLCSFAVLTVAIGCTDPKNPKAVVQGTVTMNGELASQGVVTFHPQGGGSVAYGAIHADGSFAMRIGQGKPSDLDASEIPAGEYVATVVVTSPISRTSTDNSGPTFPAPRLSAARYSNKATSELSYSIKTGLNVIEIAVENADEQMPESKVKDVQNEEQKTTILVDESKVDEEASASSGELTDEHAESTEAPLQ